MKVDFNVLDPLFRRHQTDYEQAALRALRSGWYIGGKEGEAFEQAFAARMGAKYCVGLNSGLDALKLGLRALGIGAGDEVIVPANTFIATVLAVTESGATPVFVEPDAYYNLDASRLESARTAKTRAVLPVHLCGQAANMRPIAEFAQNHGLYLLEDCAQSHTARFDGQITGTFGDIGCFSFYPTKNLGAFGDAGAVITDNADLAAQIRKLRNYGSEKKYHFDVKGVNSRLDELQAALLSVRLNHLDEIILERQTIAKRYLQGLSSSRITLPRIRSGSEHVWHLFVIQTSERDALQAYLSQKGITTQIHYPIPPHLSKCYAYLEYREGDFPITEAQAKTILSLPLYNGMSIEEIDYVIDCINQY